MSRRAALSSHGQLGYKLEDTHTRGCQSPRAEVTLQGYARTYPVGCVNFSSSRLLTEWRLAFLDVEFPMGL